MKSFSVILLLLLHSFLLAQKDNSIWLSFEVENQSVRATLDQIEEQIQYKFSYNTRLIDRDSLLTYKAENQSLELVIDELFSEKVKLKIVGQHLVLLEREKEKKQEITKALLFTGQILNARTQEPIARASVYDLSTRETVLSDSLGRFRMKSNSNRTLRNYSIAKRTFMDTIISVDLELDQNFEISLLPSPIAIAELKPQLNKEIPIQEKSDFLMGMVSEDALITLENLSYIYEERPAQISFFPILGTNLTSSGIIQNKFSLNVFGGYNGGVRGVEIGGFFNIISKDVKGVQIGGISNVVLGKTEGLQIGGIINKTKLEVKGYQLGGIGNWATGDLIGLQIGGIFNFNQGRFRGFQLGGIVSTNIDKLKGAQISGIANVNGEDINGFQLAGISNFVRGDVIGLQVSGISNTSWGETIGIQLSGISNVSKGKMKGMQVGLVNSAKDNNGLQLGLFNFSKNSKGFALGLFNIVVNGYHALELSANEIFYTNLTFKIGSRHFYNIYKLSFDPVHQDRFGNGYGFGSNFDLYKKLSLSVDLSANFIQKSDHKADDFNIVNTMDLSLDYRWSEHFSLVLGVSYNIYYSKYENEWEDYFNSNLPIASFNAQSFNNYYSQSWIGGKLAVRYIF